MIFTHGIVPDANGAYADLSFDSLKEDEYFKALEFGWTEQDLSGPTFLFNNVHIAMWKSDTKGKGVALTGTYTFEEQRIGTFVRFSRPSSDSTTPYQMPAYDPKRTFPNILITAPC